MHTLSIHKLPLTLALVAGLTGCKDDAGASSNTYDAEIAELQGQVAELQVLLDATQAQVAANAMDVREIDEALGAIDDVDAELLEDVAGTLAEHEERLRIIEDTPYATQRWVQDQGFADASDVTAASTATQSWVADQDYASASDIDSALSGYATESWASGRFATSSDVSSVQAEAAANAADISSLESSMSSVESDVAANTSDIAALDTSVSAVESDVAANASDISSLESSMGSVEADVATNTSDVSDLGDDYRDLQGDISDNADDITTNADAIAQVEADISDLESSISDAETDISDIESDMSGMLSDISSMSSDISSNSGNISANAADISTAETDIDGNYAMIKTNENDLGDLEGDVSALETATDGVEDLMSYVDVDTSDDSVSFVGANLFVQSGAGTTDGTVNGLGNLVVGYDEDDSSGGADKSGSHNIVFGVGATYRSFGGLVGGEDNAVEGEYSVVVTGADNAAQGDFGVVLGGYDNAAYYNDYSVVVGGYGNDARGKYSAVLGGSNEYLVTKYGTSY